MRTRRFVITTFTALQQSRALLVLTRMAAAVSFAFLGIGVAQAQIHVTDAEIGCLDLKQNQGNLTSIVGNACNGKFNCSFKAPTPSEYQAEHVQVHGRSFCTQAMDITYQCVGGRTKFANVPGDAWSHPPAELSCEPAAPPPGSVSEPIQVIEARIGCLDIQKSGNLTALVAGACNNRGSCSYKAPTPDEYTRAGVQAAGRSFCTQGMEITYRCGQNDPQIVTVPGNAWDHPPAELNCVGSTIATNHQHVTVPKDPKENCLAPLLGPPAYFTPPERYARLDADAVAWGLHLPGIQAAPAGNSADVQLASGTGCRLARQHVGSERRPRAR